MLRKLGFGTTYLSNIFPLSKKGGRKHQTPNQSYQYTHTHIYTHTHTHAHTHAHILVQTMVSRQSRALLFSTAALLLAVEPIGAFESSTRVIGKPSLAVVGRNCDGSFQDGEKHASTRCASMRTQQSEDVEETSFLMKPFATASGEIVYVLVFL